MSTNDREIRGATLPGANEPSVLPRIGSELKQSQEVTDRLEKIHTIISKLLESKEDDPGRAGLLESLRLTMKNYKDRIFDSNDPTLRAVGEWMRESTGKKSGFDWTAKLTPEEIEQVAAKIGRKVTDNIIDPKTGRITKSALVALVGLATTDKHYVEIRDRLEAERAERRQRREEREGRGTQGQASKEGDPKYPSRGDFVIRQLLNPVAEGRSANPMLQLTMAKELIGTLLEMRGSSENRAEAFRALRAAATALPDVSAAIDDRANRRLGETVRKRLGHSHTIDFRKELSEHDKEDLAKVSGRSVSEVVDARTGKISAEILVHLVSESITDMRLSISAVHQIKLREEMDKLESHVLTMAATIGSGVGMPPPPARSNGVVTPGAVDDYAKKVKLYEAEVMKSAKMELALKDSHRKLSFESAKTLRKPAES